MSQTTFSLTMPSAAKARQPAKPGFFKRLLAAAMRAQQRRAEREIARYLAMSGLKFTDSTEREIERRLSPSRAFDPN